jgi:hypothetical protein
MCPAATVRNRQTSNPTACSNPNIGIYALGTGVDNMHTADYNGQAAKIRRELLFALVAALHKDLAFRHNRRTPGSIIPNLQHQTPQPSPVNGIRRPIACTVRCNYCHWATIRVGISTSNLRNGYDQLTSDCFRSRASGSCRISGPEPCPRRRTRADAIPAPMLADMPLLVEAVRPPPVDDSSSAMA